MEKVHAVVARSTFRSKNVQHITKHLRVGALLEFEMSKKCTPLWRGADLEVNMCKAPQLRTAFGSWDVERVHAVVGRSTLKCQNTSGRGTFGS